LELAKPSLENIQRLNHSFSWQCAIGELLRFSGNSKGLCEDEFELRRKVGTICSGVGSQCTDSTLQTLDATHLHLYQKPSREGEARRTPLKDS